MLQLNNDNIKLNQSSNDKHSAIKVIAADLSDKGLVQEGYLDGMLCREEQSSTFLGNGIAIPHGTTDTRDRVNKTGVSVLHFPDGVNWGDGNIAYVVIGIAAKSDEHLGILKQLTKVLSADGAEQKLKHAKSAEEIIAILSGEMQLDTDINTSLIQLNFPTNDMVQMAAVAAGLLKNTGNVDTEFVAELVSKSATHLGKGLWLISSDKAVTRTTMALVSAASPFEQEGNPVHALIAIAACNNAHQAILDKITELVFKQEQEKLFTLTEAQVLSFFTGEEIADTASSDSNVAVFKIRNAHGLHARPGAMLVAEAKKFEAVIKVANLSSDGKVVNAKSLMKVIGLGVKHGHELQFTAEGADATEALAAIGKAIASGLGEH
ncbi:fused PTS fructose transporter subunit IIA/HPr protein [Agarivorans litoreus]|uniref:fused PTS fructose transporter subunit IIA/HPr protein n=1 Tax=Agarivorans litoreus TaxID=1510455 RepID=UPI001C7DC8EA|nr:fused PTS fructose transporter subunit IIA/HPr protein [Agarivorans litoreus]